jgi:hypothetical protein
VAEESRVFLTMDKGIANITVYQPKRFSGLAPIVTSVFRISLCSLYPIIVVCLIAIPT